ncbi:CDP-alcohol phosphatidyltransferase-like enzyme [Stackebrandtia endophytica]|uniref:CDP-alcohol phosphatidyltransferase-like enzyme n=1 Tax=Stackebrandtia endophytica TaxID=1496996 RepID=A0A543AZQ2_9ACTN|nr:DUF5941 domain-containing protein [Stackebrandtia endophytica]TQL78036.1 CDP-alcohol phosphatidyltransferase-like enzyme [Stackebrandtia endophytica]
MRAVLLATTHGAEALLPSPHPEVTGDTVFGRLRRQLARFDVTDLTVIGRPELMPGLPLEGARVTTSTDVDSDLRLLSEACADGDEAILVLTADALLADTAISSVLSDPTERSGALVGSPDHAGTAATAVFRDRGLILSVGTTFHHLSQPNGAACGVLKISTPYLSELRAAVRQLIADDVAELADGSDAWTLTLLALARRGTKLTAYSVPGVPYGRAVDQAETDALLTAIKDCDEDAVRLQLCVKADDDLFATYSISSYSRHLVKLCQKLRLTPVGVTWISIVLAVVAAGLFATADRTALIVGAVLMYASFTFDCVDGQLARYTHRFSAFGGWLDMIADRGKEYLLYGGLAFGAAASGIAWAWPLAIAAIGVQVVRHMTDTWYGTMQDTASLAKATRSLLYADDGFTGSGSGAPGSAAVRLGKKLGKLSAQFASQRRTPAYWFKRTIVFPVGERWLVMGLGAAIFDGGIALAALLVGQLIALGYTLAGRGLRSWAAKVAVLARPDKATHRDDGPIVRLLRRAGLPPLPVLAIGLVAVTAAIVVSAQGFGIARLITAGAGLVFLTAVFTASHRHAGPFDWLVPGALRAGEYGLAIACGLAVGVPMPLLYGLLFALSLYHYDLAARVDKAASPLDSREYGLGWDGRVVVLLISLIPGIGVWVFALFTAHMLLVFLGGAILGSRAAARTAAARPVAVNA